MLGCFSPTICLSVPHNSSSITPTNDILALGGSAPLRLSQHHEVIGVFPKGQSFLLFLFSLPLPLTLHKPIEVSSLEGCSNHPYSLPPRNPTQGHWGEPVPDPAACHHHQHHGQWPPPKHFLSQLQWPCRRQQAAGPSSSGCWN